jgi:hypothetical protein
MAARLSGECAADFNRFIFSSHHNSHEFKVSGSFRQVKRFGNPSP